MITTSGTHVLLLYTNIWPNNEWNGPQNITLNIYSNTSNPINYPKWTQQYTNKTASHRYTHYTYVCEMSIFHGPIDVIFMTCRKMNITTSTED